MNAEVLAILKDTLICFNNGFDGIDGFSKNQLQCSHWICNHIDFKNAVAKDPLYRNGEVAIDYIADNRPTETLFPEIFNGYGYDQSLKDDAFWFGPYDAEYKRADIQAQKIKYLELLIAKLENEINNTNNGN